MMFKRTIACATAFGLWAATLFVPLEAMASQNALLSPTTGTVSGLQLTNNYNNALDSVNTCNSGASAPTNQLSGGPSAGNCWYQTGTGAWSYYDGTNWLTAGYIDAANHVFTPVVGGNAATTVASATTTNLCGSSGASPIGMFLTISGTTTITGFGTNCVVGQMKVLKFSGILTLTYNSGSMILPTAANVTTAVGDIAVAIYLGSGNWQVVIYQPASGAALSSSLNFTGALFFNGQISPASLSGSQNNYSPSGIATANVVRLTSSAAVNITGLLAPATNGQRVTIQNINAVGGFNITLTANDTNSTAANRFLLPHPIGLQPFQSVPIIYDATSGGWRLDQKVYSSPAQGAFKNLRVFNVGTYLGDSAPSTPNSQIKIAADEIILEDGNGNTVKATSVACLIDFTLSGAGGLDTSSLAAGNLYYEFVIFNPSTNTTSCIGSLASATASVTLPSGYTFIARVGCNGYVTLHTVTGFHRVVQYGRQATYVVTSGTPTATLPFLSNTGGEGSITAPTWISKSVGGYIPVTASRIDMILYGSGAADDAMVAPSNSYGAFNSTTNPPPCVLFAATTTAAVQQCSLNLESGNVYTANNFTNFLLAVYGWTDNL